MAIRKKLSYVSAFTWNLYAVEFAAINYSVTAVFNSEVRENTTVDFRIAAVANDNTFYCTTAVNGQLTALHFYGIVGIKTGSWELFTVKFKRNIACNSYRICNIVRDILIQRYSSRTYLISLSKSVINIAEQICLFASAGSIAYSCNNFLIAVRTGITVKHITAVFVLMVALINKNSIGTGHGLNSFVCVNSNAIHTIGRNYASTRNCPT